MAGNAYLSIVNGAKTMLRALQASAGASSAGSLVALNSSGLVDPSMLRAVPWSVQPGMGDGVNAIPAGTYVLVCGYNDSGATITLTGIKGYADAGSSTFTVTNGTGTALMTGALTCSSSFPAGTQSATVTLGAGDYLQFTFTLDGTTKQIGAVVSGTHA